MTLHRSDIGNKKRARSTGMKTEPATQRRHTIRRTNCPDQAISGALCSRREFSTIRRLKRRLAFMVRPAARKGAIMAAYERGEITAAGATILIGIMGLKAA